MDLNTKLKMQDFARQWTAAQPVVASFIRSLAPNHHDAEEILQQTAAALVAKFDDFDSSRSFVAWAVGVARIEVLRTWDARRREREVFTFDTDTVEAVAEVFSTKGQDLAALHSAVDECVRRLSGKLREIFRLSHVEELTPTQIADRLGRSPNAVMVALHRGRLTVRDCLKTRFAFDGGSLK